MTKRKDTYFEEPLSEVATSSEERKELQRRIDREVVVVEEEDIDPEDEEVEEDATEVERDEDEAGDVNAEGEEREDRERGEAEEEREGKRRGKSLVQHIITGTLLTDGTVPYYRYFIAIAIMCFLSIVLTFMSLNTSNECRRKEKQITLLHERSVVKEEQRYELSTKASITERLKQNHNIELVDLSRNSRRIE